MAADEASGDPDPTGGEMQRAGDNDQKSNPTEDHKSSMLPRFIYDASSVVERLMQRADAAAASSSAGDGETSKGIHPNNTKVKIGSPDESNPNWAPFKPSIVEFMPTMSSQAVSSNTTSGSPGKGDTTSSMLGPFIYDTSPLADRLIQRAMAAATAATTTMPVTKDKTSNDIDVKGFEGSREAMVKL